MFNRSILNYLTFISVKCVIFLYLSTCLIPIAKGQTSGNYSFYKGKPALDSSILNYQWPALWDKPVLSPDGKYVAYLLGNIPLGKSTLILQETNAKWKSEYRVDNIERSNFLFSKDSRLFLFKHADTLSVINVKENTRRDISKVASFQSPGLSKGEWVTYETEGESKVHVLMNILTGSERSFTNVTGIHMDQLGRGCILQRDLAASGTPKQLVEYLRFANDNINVLWTSQKNNTTAGYFAFSSDGNQISFIVTNRDSVQSRNSIWNYKTGSDRAEIILDEVPFPITPTLLIANTVPTFSNDGRWIFFTVYKQTPPPGNVNPALAKVDIWSYKDVVLKPQQALETESRFWAAVPVVGGRPVLLQRHPNDEIQTSLRRTVGENPFVIVKEDRQTPYWWPHSDQPSVFMVSLKDGSRKLLAKNSNSLFLFSVSPTGKYLVYWDSDLKSYICYNSTSGNSLTVAKTVPTDLVSDVQRTVETLPVSFYNPIWIENDSFFILNDNYDLWKIDPTGKSKSVNITRGFGKINLLKFRLIDEDESEITKKQIYKGSDSIILLAFDSRNKYSGFYTAKINASADPERLYMGPCTFDRKISQTSGKAVHFSGNCMQPVKASASSGYVVLRSSYDEYPNYFYTPDLRSYTKLTDLKPEKSYNWLKAELLTWKQFDGSNSQGILYKPENFDSTKKYPVIFNYYEKLSSRLYEFPEFGYSGDNINIPWFVSNGYLVFTPDIHYKVAVTSGKSVGEWAFNSIVSAAKYVAKLPYVNSAKMAVQGHSFGALETSYIITRTNIFAAAAEFAGITDPVSSYLTLVPFYSSNEDLCVQELMERGHSLYGCTLWEQPELFLKTSAVLNAHKITAPLLITHNRRDNQINWRQGLELYLALRRLGKKCWMLQYDNSGHAQSNIEDNLDYTMRLTQFFNYYLKDYSPPKWMTEGVPTMFKGIHSGLMIDSSGIVP